MGLADALSEVFSPKVKTAELESFKDFDVLAEADKLLCSTRKTPVPQPDDVYRASSLPKLCAREEVLCHVHKIERTSVIDSKLQKIFDIGESFHNLVQNKWFGRWGWLVGDWECAAKKCPRIYRNQAKPDRCDCGNTDFLYKELSFGPNEEHGVSGHLDGIVEKNGFRKVIELKTCNSKVFKFLNEIRKDATEAHKDQINIYMWISGIKFGTVIYLDKDESQWRQFPQHLDQDRVDRILKRVKDSRDGMRTGVVPPRTTCETKDCARAKSCSVRKLCFEEGEKSNGKEKIQGNGS